MTLAEFSKVPLEVALKELELSDLKIHTDDLNNVVTVELKYQDKNKVNTCSKGR